MQLGVLDLRGTSTGGRRVRREAGVGSPPAPLTLMQKAPMLLKGQAGPGKTDRGLTSGSRGCTLSLPGGELGCRGRERKVRPQCLPVDRQGHTATHVPAGGDCRSPCRANQGKRLCGGLRGPQPSFAQPCPALPSSAQLCPVTEISAPLTQEETALWSPGPCMALGPPPELSGARIEVGRQFRVLQVPPSTLSPE